MAQMLAWCCLRGPAKGRDKTSVVKGKLKSERAEMHLVGPWTFLERELQDQEEMGRMSEEATNVS